MDSRLGSSASRDPRIKMSIDDVTVRKLEALGELSHEDLRGDRLLVIFLIQCANLIRRSRRS